MTDARNAALRAIPAVESLLRDPRVDGAARGLPQPVVTGVVRRVLDETRREILSGAGAPGPDGRSLADTVVARIERDLLLLAAGRPARVVNATGIVLHTNLGRAVLGERIARRLADVAAGYTDLELDVVTGERGRREAQSELLLRVATGADRAIVVNNCAAAVLLLLDTLARGREVIVSRGELVEIGGSFRIPDVLARSGARLVEVGTTNKTRLSDYASAITSESAAILSVHRSNFRMIGFTESATTADLAGLCHERGLTLVRDLGSGEIGLPGAHTMDDEPTLREEIRSGADLVAASGDKLLGGPQAGIIAGRADLVTRALENPLYRALRPDKLTFAALTETLLLHLDGREADLPARWMLAREPSDLAEEAAALADSIAAGVSEAAEVSLVDGVSETGGGACPAVPLPTVLVAVRPSGEKAHRVEARLRGGRPPVLARVADDRILFDPRTLLPGEAEIVVASLVDALLGGRGDAP